MRIKFFLLLKIHLFFVVSVWADLLEKQAWEKAYPQNPEDLRAIQAQLQSLLPDAEKAVVSIETGDGAGSGVIISPEGLVLTAAHVIGSTGKRMKVRLHDGKRLSAISLGGSELSDAGMLKIKGRKNLPYAPVSEKDLSSIGDWCFALGHPGGFDSERGVIVRLGRIIGKKNETMQTDSRLLGGDSGGPLFDFEGQVIAIHSRVSSQPDQNFHIPIESFHANWEFFRDESMLTLDSLGEGGFLGISCEESTDGLLVNEVLAGTPAEEAGIIAGDLLLKLDGDLLSTRENLTISVSQKKPGDIVRITYEREGNLLSSEIKLARRSEE